MLRVVFTDGDKELVRQMERDELEVLQIHKPKLDMAGDGWEIIDFRYNVETGSFTCWIEKE